MRPRQCLPGKRVAGGGLTTGGLGGYVAYACLHYLSYLGPPHIYILFELFDLMTQFAKFPQLINTYF